MPTISKTWTQLGLLADRLPKATPSPKTYPQNNKGYQYCLLGILVAAPHKRTKTPFLPPGNLQKIQPHPLGAESTNKWNDDLPGWRKETPNIIN